MDHVVKPYVIRIEELKNGELGNKNRNANYKKTGWWYVDLEVCIGDRYLAERYRAMNIFAKFYARHFIDEYLNRTNGMLDLPLFYLVCSPAYLDNPDVKTHSEADISKALVQEEYDGDTAKRIVAQKVESIGETTFTELTNQLKQFMDVTPWADD